MQRRWRTIRRSHLAVLVALLMAALSLAVLPAARAQQPAAAGSPVSAGEQADCPETDGRPLVVVGDERTQVPNRVAADGCTVNELIQDERGWASKQAFREHVREVADGLRADGVINRTEQHVIEKAARQSGIGGKGGNGYRKLFDGSAESFAAWEQVGGGAFHLNGDGSMTSSGGMGMLWFPEQEYGDFSLRLQFRDDAPGDGRANSGVFVRFPWVHDHPEESRPEWVAIKYGHEIQINDAADGDQYKTGSLYGFDLVDRAGAMVTEKGSWNDYEIRVVDQHYSVYRNGVLINEFENAPGQLFSPPRADDPGTDGRQHDSGYIGLQNHSDNDVISFRDIRVKPL